MVSLEYEHQDKELFYSPSLSQIRNSLSTGRYRFDYAKLSYRSDFRKYFGWMTGVQYGSFFNGTRLETSLNLTYRVQPWGNFCLEFRL